MSHTKFVAVVFLLASSVVQANQCSHDGECPSNGEPQSGVSLLQTKLQTNVIKDVKKPARVEVEELDPKVKMEFPTHAGLNFIHIPKCAGTTIEDVGRQNHMPWGRFDSCSGWKTRHTSGECCSPWHSPRFLQASCPNLATDSFCVTRDPYDRLVSQYIYDQAGKTCQLEAEAKCQHSKEAADCSSAGLNRYIKQGLSQIQKGNYCIWDCHARPQSDFIWRLDGSRFCRNVLRLDEFPDAFNNLMASHNMSPIQLSRAHNEAVACEHLTADNFTAETRSLIESVYAADFSKLNYSIWSFRI